MNNTFEARFNCKNYEYGYVFNEENIKFYIQPKNFNRAFDQDTVLVEIIDKDKKTAKIVKVIKRNDKPYIGSIIRFKNGKPIIRLSKSNLKIIGKTKFPKSKINDLVSFKIDYNYSIFNKKYIIGKIVRNFGQSNCSENRLLSILYSKNIDLNFKDDILKGTILNFSVFNELKKGRVDLREQEAITIDGVYTKDIDDAIYLEKDENTYTIYVHIADVSHFVKEDSNLDLEALKRGNSIYLNNKVIPMFPKILSNNLCSLNPNEDKLAFTVKIKYNLKGKVIDSDFFKSVINIKQQMNYDQVNEIFENDDKENYEMLFNMLEFSKIIRKNKLFKGMINFDFPDIKLVYDDNNNIVDIYPFKRKEAENLIEDFMVEANIAVSEKLFWQDIPTIYRVHEKPDLETLNNLNKKLSLFGYNIHNIAEIYPGKLSKILDDCKNDPNSFIINKYILRSMKHASYDFKNLGHFALGLPSYLHFTSPIRRYSDLVVHRMLNYSLENKKHNPKYLQKLENKLKKISLHISKTEKRAEQLERIALKLKLLDYMSDKVNNTYSGIINDIYKDNVYIQLENLVEVIYKNADVLDDILTSNGKKYSIGDKVSVKIVKIDYERIEIIAEVIDEDIS